MQYPPNFPSGRPQPPLLSHSYRGWTLAILVIAYLAALIMVSVDASVMNGASSGLGVVGVCGLFLLIALHIFLIIKDRHSFFTLFGRIQWRRMNIWLRLGLSFVYLSGWIMYPIYLV